MAEDVRGYKLTVALQQTLAAITHTVQNSRYVLGPFKLEIHAL